MDKKWFWFTIGCHVLYQSLWEDEYDSGLSQVMLADLELELSKEYKETPKLGEWLKQEFPKIHERLIDRLEFWSKSDTVSIIPH